MTGFRLSLVAILLLLPGCNTPTSPVQEATYVEVMVELHLLDARPELADSYDALREAILRRHNVRATAIDSAVVYYSEHPDEYADVYTRIIDRLAEASTGSRRVD